MKTHSGEIWIDGFNLFHQWEETRALFQSAGAVNLMQREAIRALAVALGTRRRHCTLFMDGGLNRQSFSLEGLRVRYPGPGAKADDLMEECANIHSTERRLAVTNDNFLAATLRRRHCRVIGAAEFIRSCLTHPRKQPATPSYKTRILSSTEVEEWLDVFDDGTTGEHAEL